MQLGLTALQLPHRLELGFRQRDLGLLDVRAQGEDRIAFGYMGAPVGKDFLQHARNQAGEIDLFAGIDLTKEVGGSLTRLALCVSGR